MKGAYDQWRTNIFQGTVLGDLWKVEHFDAAAEFVREEDVTEMVNVSSDLAQHVEWIRQYAELGFETIILHNVNRDQEKFINDFGRHVLPRFK
jgi:hypothetical protein